MPERIKKVLLIIAIVVLTLATARMVWSLLKPNIIVIDNRLSEMSIEELREYDGTQSNKPIYLGYEGLIYDVTAGKEYYQTGGAYHFLAGRDATVELNFAGGSIIKKKYPIVGRLSQDILTKP